MDAAFPIGMVEEIEKFLSTDASRPAGLDLYPELFTTGLFFPLQRQAELAAMIREARAIEPRSIVIIGADKGADVYSFVKSIPTVERAIACEIRGTPYAAAFERAFPLVSFRWCPWGSRDVRTRETVARWAPIDVLFIDGDKATMYEDFLVYEPGMRRGGIIFVHDVTDPAPGAAFRKMQEHPKVKSSRVIHDVGDVDAALVRERAGIPPSGSHEGWLRHWKGASCGVGVLYL